MFSQGRIQAFKTWLKGWRWSRASWNSRFLKSEQVAFRVPCAISALTSSPCESSGCSQSSAFAHQWWRGEDCFNIWKSFRWLICPSCLPWFEADVLTDFDDQPVVMKILIVSGWWFPITAIPATCDEFTLGNLFWTCWVPSNISKGAPSSHHSANQGPRRCCSAEDPEFGSWWVFSSTYGGKVRQFRNGNYAMIYAQSNIPEYL